MANDPEGIREQFEDWYSDGIRGQLKRTEDGRYAVSQTNFAWQVWCAVRSETVREIVGKLRAEADHDYAIGQLANRLRAIAAELEAGIPPSKLEEKGSAK